MPRPTNTDLANIGLSAIRRYTALANATPGCVKLTLGEPEFGTPEPVRAEVSRSLERGLTHYPPNNGRPELLAAISDYMAGQGFSYAPEEIIVTNGATEALSATLLALLDPGDEVVIPEPAFLLYDALVRAGHGVSVPLDTAPNGFQITREALRARVGPRTKAVVITSPNNPTGCVYTAATLDAVAEVAAETGIYVICDDVYNRLSYAGDFERMAARHAELREQLVVVDSFSKPWAMTGWRLGWLAAAPALKAQIEKMHQYLVVSVPTFLQDAAIVALGCDVEPMRATYRARRGLVCERLEAMGLSCVRPEGAFYAFPSIEDLGLGSDEFCERAIREAGVALVPGSCFGGEGHVRLSYCVSNEDLACGLDRLAGFVDGLRASR